MSDINPRAPGDPHDPMEQIFILVKAIAEQEMAAQQIVSELAAMRRREMRKLNELGLTTQLIANSVKQSEQWVIEQLHTAHLEWLGESLDNPPEPTQPTPGYAAKCGTGA